MTIDLYSKRNLDDSFDLPLNFFLVIVRLIELLRLRMIPTDLMNLHNNIYHSIRMLSKT